MTPIDIPTTQISVREVERYRRHQDRRHHAGTAGLVLAAIASACALLAAFLLTGCGSAPAGHPTPTARPAQVTAVLPLPVRIKNWYTSGGKAQIAAVTGDQARLADDPVDSRAMQLDGDQLQADALAAGHNLPPGNSRLYLKAMANEEAAGAWFGVGSAEQAIGPDQLGTQQLSLWADVLAGELGQ
jgi:hypothetical protein